jgi:hypothetical protein
MIHQNFEKAVLLHKLSGCFAMLGTGLDFQMKFYFSIVIATRDNLSVTNGKRNEIAKSNSIQFIRYGFHHQ